MATTIEDFKLRFTTEGGDKVKKVNQDINNLRDDINDLGQVGGPLSGTINGIVGRLGLLGTAASLAGGAFVALGASALRIAGELSDISGATGIATGQIQNFRTSLIEAGGKAEDASSILSKLNQSVQEAAGGNEKLQQAFRDLGIFVTDANGKIRPTGDILQDITAKFQAGELSGSQYAAAIDILGKNVNKLELAKLSALKDPVTDADIKRLDEYNEAIDKVRARLEKGIITFFGSVAEQANTAMQKIDELYNYQEARERKLNEQGKTIGGRLRTELTFGLNNFFPRDMTEEEKKAFREQGQSPAGFKFTPNNARVNNSNTPVNTPPAPVTGGFGVTPEATIKAVAASEKRIADLKIEAAKAAAMEASTAEFTTRMAAADKTQQTELRYQQDLAAIKIALEQDTIKAVISIKEQERLNDAQKSAEIEAKKVELTAKAEEAKAKLRQRRQDELAREKEAAEREIARINEIITRSKSVVEEQQKLNDLQEQKNKFLQENATATDIERQNAEALFNLEQERLKTLKAIQQIKDLPEGERAAREKEINEEFARRKQLTVSQQAADRSLSQNFEAGWEKAYRQYSEDSRNAFNIAGKIFNNVTQGMEDAISNFAKTGKFEFKGFVSSMLDELLRSQVRQLMASLFSFSSGNNFASSIGNLLGFASGGVIPTNNPVLVGERGPEILSGVAGRVVTPNNQIGGGAMVTYNINAVDSASFKAMIAKDPSFIHAVASQGARTIPNRR